MTNHAEITQRLRGNHRESLVRLSQGDSVVTGASDVDQSVPMPTAGANEVAAVLVNLRGDGLEHDRKAAAPASPHGPNATPLGSAGAPELTDEQIDAKATA
jgi:hypothetical protein